MTSEYNLSNMLFIDIETVPQYPSYIDLPKEKRELWNHKAKFISKGTALQAYKKAGIYAEFWQNSVYFSRVYQEKGKGNGI
jgi:hypothetical protein